MPPPAPADHQPSPGAAQEIEELKNQLSRCKEEARLKVTFPQSDSVATITLRIRASQRTSGKLQSIYDALTTQGAV